MSKLLRLFIILVVGVVVAVSCFFLFNPFSNKKNADDEIYIVVDGEKYYETSFHYNFIDNYHYIELPTKDFSYKIVRSEDFDFSYSWRGVPVLLSEFDNDYTHVFDIEKSKNFLVVRGGFTIQNVLSRYNGCSYNEIELGDDYVSIIPYFTLVLEFDGKTFNISFGCEKHEVFLSPAEIWF